MRVGWMAMVLLVACGGGGAEGGGRVENGGGGGAGGGGAGGGGGGAEPEATEDFRLLPDGATFRDLADAARRLDDRRDQESSSGCLIRPAAGARAPRLEADLAVAVRPLPAPPDDLEQRLDAACEPLRLLTRWGIAGGALPPHPLAMVAFTTTTPASAPPAAVIVGGAGTRVRTAAGCLGRSPAGPDDLSSTPVQDALRGAGVIAVTAEAGIPVARLVEVLTQLEALGRPIALAAVLDPETRLPEPAAVAGSDPDAGLCPDGLPPTTLSAEGDMSPQTLLASLGPFRMAAQRCLASATGPGAAGGRLTVAFRIGADGRVLDACAVADEIHDTALRACVLESLRAIQFPAPSPPGFVEAQLPLVLRPDDTLTQRAVCP